MKNPYTLCIINRCTQLADFHHEPPRGHIKEENWKGEKIPLCRKHHDERHNTGVETFKKKYPEFSSLV